jgi:hypothetical protein
MKGRLRAPFLLPANYPSPCLLRYHLLKKAFYLWVSEYTLKILAPLWRAASAGRFVSPDPPLIGSNSNFLFPVRKVGLRLT